MDVALTLFFQNTALLALIIVNQYSLGLWDTLAIIMVSLLGLGTI